MTKQSKVTSVEILACDAGWRNYHFVKVTTDSGIVGWSEFDEGFGSPGVSAAIERLAATIIGDDASQHERIYAKLYTATRPAAGGVVAQAIGAIENALLDAKAKHLGVPCYDLLGGKIRDRIRLYWSHCATWRASTTSIMSTKRVSAYPAGSRGCRRPKSNSASVSLRSSRWAAMER